MKWESLFLPRGDIECFQGTPVKPGVTGSTRVFDYLWGSSSDLCLFFFMAAKGFTKKNPGKTRVYLIFLPVPVNYHFSRVYRFFGNYQNLPDPIYRSVITENIF